MTGKSVVMPVDTDAVFRKVRRQQLHQLYKQGEKGLVGTLLYVFFLTYLFSDVAPTSHLLIWLGVTSAIYSSRFILIKLFYRQSEESLSLRPWHYFFLVGTILGGLAWGSFGFLFFPTSSPLHLSLFLIVVSGLCASTMVTYARSGGRVSAAFTLPALLPLAIRAMMEGGGTYWVIGILLVVYMVILLSSAELNVGMTDSNMYMAEEQSQLAEYYRQSEMRAQELVTQLQHEVDERRRVEVALRHSENELNDLFENLPDTVYRLDLDGRFTFISPQVERDMGYTPQELIGSPVELLYVSPDVRNELQRKLDESGEVRNFVSALWHKDGSKVWASANLHYYKSDDGTIAGVEGVIRDITQLKKAEDALFREQQRAMVTLESIGDGVITTDLEGVITYLNPVAERLVTVDGSPLHRHYREAFPLVDEGSGERLDDLVELTLKHHASFVNASNGLMRRSDGREFVLKVSTATMRDSGGEAIGAVLVLHDVTENIKMTRQLNYLANHDTLTGLVNRREFERCLEQAIHSAVETGNEHTLFYMDLDQFKVVNDTCGHHAGDELLKQISVQLSESLRDSDILARLGGDEFGVLLENCSLSTAEQLADKLRQVVKEYRFSWEDKSFEIGVSIGVVQVNSDTRGLGKLLSAADAACYFAKDQGRNRVYVYHDGDDATLKRHGEMSWVHRITEGFEKDRFRLYGQYISPLNGGAEIPHYEVVLRLESKEGEIVPPMAFIPAAERYNLMPTIDRWVVRTTFEKLQKLEERLGGVPMACSINLSGQSLADDHFLDFIIDQLEVSQLNPMLICFEITETAAITHLSRAMSLFGELKRRGCQFSLDDFGSGLSSFGYLKSLPVDYLKIDGAFVKDILVDKVDAAMVEAINEVGHVMDLKTIAEFVENDEIADRLRDIGVDYAQGYGISPPEPFDEILKRFT